MSIYLCSHWVGVGVESSMFEDLVFTITEKTAPNIFS